MNNQDNLCNRILRISFFLLISAHNIIQNLTEKQISQLNANVFNCNIFHFSTQVKFIFFYKGKRSDFIIV